MIEYRHDIALRQEFRFFLLHLFLLNDSWNGNNGPGVSTFWLDGWMTGVPTKQIPPGAKKPKGSLCIYPFLPLFSFSRPLPSHLS